MSRDEYYQDTAARLDTIIGGDTTHFLQLQRAKKEWDELALAVPVGQGVLTFYDYVKEYYGIKMTMDGDNISLDYAIIDEKKYTVFLLKFGR
jgi:inorganic pyrophosphatase